MNQISRFTDAELELMEKLFKNNFPLLKAIRNFILQLKLTAPEQALLVVNVKKKPEVLRILRQKLLPDISADVPFGMLSDLYILIDVKNMTTDFAYVQMRAIKIWSMYMEQQLSLLEDKKPKTDIKLNDLENFDNLSEQEAHIQIVARSYIISSTEQMLGSMAGVQFKKPETPEEREKRLHQDSAK